jgi:hypothetical protein
MRAMGHNPVARLPYGAVWAIDFEFRHRVGVEKYAHPLHFKQGRDSAVWKLITRMREEDGYGEVQ